MFTTISIPTYSKKVARLIFARFSLAAIISAMLLSSVGSIAAQNTPKPADKELTTGLTLYNYGMLRNSLDYFRRYETPYKGSPEDEVSFFYRTKVRSELIPSKRPDIFKEFVYTFPKSSNSDNLLYDLGERSYQNEQYRNAIALFNETLRFTDDSKLQAEARYLKAEAFAQRNENDKARSAFLETADKHPDTEWAPKALYARGRLHLTENRYDQATEAFELLRTRYPNHAMTRRVGTALGESYYKQERYQEAIEAFKNAIPYLEGDRESKAILMTAESYNYLDKYDDASSFYLRYINKNKGTNKVRLAHYGLGWIYNKQAIYHWAAEAFGKASTGEDELARKALYYKAVNEKLGGRYPDALETFRKFGEQYEDGLWVERAYYEWAVTAFEMGNNQETIEVLLPLARRREQLKKSGDILTLLGEAYFANGEYTRAIETFEVAEEAAELAPGKKRQAAFQKAWVLYRNQAYESAQPIFERLYNQNPSDAIAAEALFWSADSYYTLEDYGPAGAQFNEFVKNYADHELMGPALYSLGWSHFKMGRFEKAKEPLENFLNNYEPPEIALFPYNTDTQLRLGDANYATGDYQEAIRYYKMAVGAEPGGDYAMFQIANSYYRAERSFEAVSTFRRLLRIYPFTRFREQAQYNIAYIYFLTGNYSQAVDEFQSVIQKYPQTQWAARSQYSIGDAYYNAGTYEKAVQEYKKVMNEYPRSPYIVDAVNGIQYSQLAAGEQDSSSAALEDFLQEHPQTSTADQLRFRQAESKLQMGDYDTAIKDFKQYLRVTNNENRIPKAYFNLADAYQQSGRQAKAIETYQLIIENYPNSEQASTSLAILAEQFLQQGNLQKALNLYEQLEQKGSRYEAEALVGIGETQLMMENYNEAEAYFKRAAQSRSSSDMAKLGLAKIELERQNYRKAENMFDEISNNNVGEAGAEAQYLKGLALQNQGLYQKALDEYARVSVLYEAYRVWVAKSLLKTAESYIAINDKGQAVKTLNTIIDQYPDSEQAAEAQNILERIN